MVSGAEQISDISVSKMNAKCQKNCGEIVIAIDGMMDGKRVYLLKECPHQKQESLSAYQVAFADMIG